MSNLQNYSKGKIFINGNELTESADFKLNRNASLMPQNTMAKGFAGFSQGASYCEIEVTNCTPNAGFEYDSGADQDQSNIVLISIQCSGKTYSSRGGITGDDLSGGVEAATKLSFKFHGEFSQWIS